MIRFKRFNFLPGVFHSVELAGSECLADSEAVGERAKESKFINKSLSTLGMMIMQLGEKNRHVSYRNSRLTMLLWKCIGGQGNTVMISHLSPNPLSKATNATLDVALQASQYKFGPAVQ